MRPTSEKLKTSCFHCGDDCSSNAIHLEEKIFCCTGCKTIYAVLQQNGLCKYYDLNTMPGVTQKLAIREGKFSFLDDEKIAASFIGFKDTTQTQASFYLPQIHCSSCLWLLENLQKINEGVLTSRVDFTHKTVTILFDHRHVSIRKVAEMLADIGYEPHMSLSQLKDDKEPGFDKSLLYKLGIAGFCFGNIMLLSFPEYFGLGSVADHFQFAPIFRYLSLALALPVFFYSASDFYDTAWKGIVNRFLNIDAPIVLAIFITFGRSLYEIFTGTGSGYLDSMTGIIFFMLIGRLLQQKTHTSLSFNREYTSYFPIAVNKLVDGKEVAIGLPQLRNGDHIVVYNNEIIPADGMLVRGDAGIDYSFVTGEMAPVKKQISELIYAGGRQVGGKIELLLVKDVSHSYLASLWNKASMPKETTEEHSFVHALSKYFTVILFGIALSVAIYWLLHDPSKVWTSVTAVLIIACPCALLLSSSFTNGHMLQWFDKGKCYLRNAMVLEKMAGVDYIVFDKTGTLTSNGQYRIQYTGDTISLWHQQLIKSVAEQSSHPFSKALATFLNCDTIEVLSFKEKIGQGCEAWIDDEHVILGSQAYVFGSTLFKAHGSVVAFRIGALVKGIFIMHPQFRGGMDGLLNRLHKKYKVAVLSGDNDSSAEQLLLLAGKETPLFFYQSPEDKLNHIVKLQQQGHKVMMIGDGLNDAGALLQSDVGIAVTESTNNFSPACDCIMEASMLQKLDRIILLAIWAKRIVIASFVLSILYNVIGLSIAVQGDLRPVIAAILMPLSSISIIVFTWLSVKLIGDRLLDK